MTREQLQDAYGHRLFGIVCEALRSSADTSGQLGMKMDGYRLKIEQILNEIHGSMSPPVPKPANNQPYPQQGVKR